MPALGQRVVEERDQTLRLHDEIAVVVGGVVNEGDRDQGQSKGGDRLLQVDIALAQVDHELYKRDEHEQEGDCEQDEAERAHEEEPEGAQLEPDRLEGDVELLPSVRGEDAVERKGRQHEDDEDDAIPARRWELEQTHAPRPEVAHCDAPCLIALSLDGTETPNYAEQHRDPLAVLQPLVASEHDHPRQGYR